ncbi:UNVERIFIED_CONTAM: hypothetical protein GTU68_022959 [Idotea baltica]|nr:hypothetical protein [Idotea baltica]
MKDYLRSPSQDIVYWVEYVIRHNGAKHLQSPLVHLSWYQIYNVDVWLLVAAICIVLLVLFSLLIKTCVKYCWKQCFKRKID